MIADSAHRILFVTLSSGGGALAVAGVPQEHATTAATIGVFIAVIAAAIAWFDSRVEKRLSAHEKAEFERIAARDKLEEERHRGLMNEIGHVKELIDLRGEIRSMRRRMTNGNRNDEEAHDGGYEGGSGET